jgi:dipeptidyl aminopeptidase/acylaminoacyl peptidase
MHLFYPLWLAWKTGRELQMTKRAISPEDILKIDTLSQIQLSRGGRWISYACRRPHLEDNVNEQIVFYKRVGEDMPRRATAEGVPAYEHKWHPTQDRLTFLSTDDAGSAQVFTLNPNTGAREQVTHLNQSISGFAFSPDGSHMALVLADQKATDLWWEGTKPPWIIDRQQFKADGIGYLDRTRTHLYVLEISSQTLKQITFGDFDDEMPVWSPDGRMLAFQSNRTDDPDANTCVDIWTVPVEGNDHSLTRISVTADIDAFPQWSPSGRYIAYQTYETPEYFYFSLRKMAVFDHNTGETRLVPEAQDRSVHAARFSPDGQYLYYLFEDRGTMNLARTNLRTFEHELVTDGNRYVFSFALAASGCIAVLLGGYDQPGSYNSSGNVHILEGGELRQITHHNEAYFADVHFSEPEEVLYESSDGKQIQAWLYKPRDFDTANTYPLVIDIHGGPVMQFGWRFEDMAQLLAANGYLVLCPNIRGSSGYGLAHQLGAWKVMGAGIEMDDVKAAAEHLCERPYVDSDRVAIQGWSHGGGVTMLAITRMPDMFAAAIAGAGTSSRLFSYGTDLYQAVTEKMYGTPWEHPDEWSGNDAFADVAKAKTPTMFVSGERDYNVVVSNSERMYQAMKRLKRETLLVVYPGEAHVIQSPKYEHHRLNMYLSWYEKHLMHK